MKNSKIYYMYRDAGNYKFYHEVIIRGKLSLEDLKPFFHDHDFFIPTQFGWPDLQPEPLTDNDHIWHQIYEVESTNEKETYNISSNELISKFRNLSSKNWNEFEVILRKGII